MQRQPSSGDPRKSASSPSECTASHGLETAAGHRQRGAQASTESSK